MKNTDATGTTTDQAATIAEQPSNVTPAKPASKKAATKNKPAPKANKTAKAEPKPAKQPKAKKAAKPAKEGATFRPGTKGAKILELISRPKGASLAELMKAATCRRIASAGSSAAPLARRWDAQSILRSARTASACTS